jgi:cyanophycinase-like exopeptidase
LGKTVLGKKTVDFDRIAGRGWLALLGGGEFSFGQTEDADRAWLARVPAGATVGFLPTASGSTEYGGHFAAYLAETFARRAETIPIYRAKDAKRVKNSRRIAECGAVYLGGGVVDHLLDALSGTPAAGTPAAGTPAAEALAEKLGDGGVIVAIAAAAQALGKMAPSLVQGGLVAGLGWLRTGAVAPNFEPRDERRLRELVEHPAVAWGLGIPAGSAVLLGPEGELETVGDVFVLDGRDGEIKAL